MERKDWKDVQWQWGQKLMNDKENLNFTLYCSNSFSSIILNVEMLLFHVCDVNTEMGRNA